jgi:carboxyl-terminal processing protease
LYRRVRWLVPFIVCLTLVVIGTTTWWWQGQARQGRYRDLLYLLPSLVYITTDYYQPVDTGRLWNVYWKTGKISEMLKTLNDPYTRFLNRKEYQELRTETRGTFGGIGVHMLPQNGDLIIARVMPGTPSERAGLRQGDRITHINGRPIRNLSVEVVTTRIRGPAGSIVRLTVKRGSTLEEKELEFAVIRADIRIPTVEMKIEDDPILGKYARIRIYQFVETTPVDLTADLSKLDQRADVKGLLLDLRGNPGGSLDAVVKVTSQFLPPGTPVLHIYQRGKLLETRRTEYSRHRYLPMVVLVDAWSASAAEILAGALKDEQRAVLIGTRTFGKDLIQGLEPLPGGTAMKITIANYLTSGRVNIHRRGVTPHQIVEIKGAFDRLLKKGEEAPFRRMQELQNQAALEALRKQVLQPEVKQAS